MSSVPCISCVYHLHFTVRDIVTRVDVDVDSRTVTRAKRHEGGTSRFDPYAWGWHTNNVSGCRSRLSDSFRPHVCLPQAPAALYSSRFFPTMIGDEEKTRAVGCACQHTAAKPAELDP